MSQENAQHILELLNIIFRSNDNVKINAATAEIDQLLKNEGSIFDLFLILQQCPDNTFRRVTLILISQYICKLILAYSSEQIQQIKEMLISLLQNEEDIQCRISLCDLINVLVSDKKLSFQWAEVYEYANQMLQNENLFTTGLYLWGLIFNTLTEEIKIRVSPFLIETCQQALGIDNKESRVYGTYLLQTVLWETCSKIDYTQVAESFVPILIQVLKKVFLVDQDIWEANSLVKNISEILSVPEVFEAFVIKFAQLGIEIMSQEDLPLELRVKAYGLIENDNSSGFAKLLDQDFKIVQNNLILFINMMVQFLQVQRIESTFDFAGKFFQNAGASIEGNGIFIFMYKSACQLAVNLGPIGIQVGLFLLYSIVESQQEYFSEYIDFIIKYILTYADCDDDYILHYSFCLLSELSDYATAAITSKINSIVAYLTKNIAHPEAPNTLDYVLDRSLHPPDNLPEFLQNLINICQQANSEQIVITSISCIASSISSSFHPCEEIYGMICPILNQALQVNNNEMQKVAIRCFGNLSLIAPRSSSTEIEKLSTILMQILTAPAENSDLMLVSEAVICLRKICQNLPISFLPFFDGFVQVCMALLTNVYPIKQGETEGEKENDYFQDEFYIINEQLLLCVATFISSYPQKMLQFAEPFYQLLVTAQKNDNLTIPFCKSIKIAARGFKAIGTSCFPIFTPILNQLRSSENIDMMIEIHNTLTSLIIYCGDQIDAKIASTICLHLTNGIGGQYLPGYLMFEISPSIHIRLIPPIFKCLIQFIDLMGPNIKPFSKDIINAVEQYLTNPCKSVCGLAAEVYAKLGSSVDDGDNLNKIAGHFIFENMKLKRTEMQESISRSLRYLLFFNTELFVSNSQLFISYAENLMKIVLTKEIDSEILKHSIIAFWCSLVMLLQLTPGEEIISMVIEALPPPPSDENIPTIALFASYAMKNFPSVAIQEKLPFIAAATIASEQSIILKIRQNVIGEMIQILSMTPQDNLGQLVYFNEGKLLRLMENLSKLIESAPTGTDPNENSGNRS